MIYVTSVVLVSLSYLFWSMQYDNMNTPIKQIPYIGRIADAILLFPVAAIWFLMIPFMVLG